MNELDHLIIAFCLGFLSGFLWFSYRLVKNIREVMNEMGVKEGIIEPKTSNPVFFTELVNGVILTYDKHSNNFITQGNNLDEIAIKLFENKIKTCYVIHEKIVYLIDEGKVAIHKA